MYRTCNDRVNFHNPPTTNDHKKKISVKAWKVNVETFSTLPSNSKQGDRMKIGLIKIENESLSSSIARDFVVRLHHCTANQLFFPALFHSFLFSGFILLKSFPYFYFFSSSDFDGIRGDRRNCIIETICSRLNKWMKNHHTNSKLSLSMVMRLSWYLTRILLELIEGRKLKILFASLRKA